MEIFFKVRKLAADHSVEERVPFKMQPSKAKLEVLKEWCKNLYGYFLRLRHWMSCIIELLKEGEPTCCAATNTLRRVRYKENGVKKYIYKLIRMLLADMQCR